MNLTYERVIWEFWDKFDPINWLIKITMIPLTGAHCRGIDLTFIWTFPKWYFLCFGLLYWSWYFDESLSDSLNREFVSTNTSVKSCVHCHHITNKQNIQNFEYLNQNDFLNVSCRRIVFKQKLLRKSYLMLH